MSASTDWTTPLVLDRVQTAIEDHLQDWINDVLAKDALRPAADRLYSGVLPMPVHYGRGESMDFAQQRVTPSLYIDTASQVVRELDASHTYDVTTRLVVSAMVSEADVAARDARGMLYALQAYLWGVAWCIREWLPRIGCDAGVIDASTVDVRFSPDVVTEQSVWLRIGELQMDVQHRVLGSPTL